MNAPRLPAITDELRAAYLARIGATVAPPSIDALRALQRAHVGALPHESTWIHLGDEWDLDPVAAIERFAHSGRGGYCYHLNGGFATLLHSLGYDVTLHRGAVHGPDGPTDGLGNHLVLTVAGLESGESPDGRWYVDVGLGEGMYEPLPLVAGDYPQGPCTYRFERAPADAPPEHGDWRLTNDHPACTVDRMAFDAAQPVGLDVFAEQHRHLSHDSDSWFVSMLLVHRRDERGIDSLIGLNLARVETERVGQLVDRRADWFAALADVFGITLQDCDASRRDVLWAKTYGAHEAWLATKRDQRGE